MPRFNKSKMELIKELQKQENAKSNSKYRKLDAVKAGKIQNECAGK